MLHDLLTERQKRSFSWGWYITVALQRIHGISPEKVREIRANMRNAETPSRGTLAPTPVSSVIPAHFGRRQHSSTLDRRRASGGPDSFREQLRALAATKSIR